MFLVIIFLGVLLIKSEIFDNFQKTLNCINTKIKKSVVVQE